MSSKLWWFSSGNDYSKQMEILSDDQAFNQVLNEAINYLYGVLETMPVSGKEDLEKSKMYQIIRFISHLDGYAHYRKQSNEISDYYHDVINQYKKELEEAKKQKTVKMKYSLFKGWHEIQEGKGTD